MHKSNQRLKRTIKVSQNKRMWHHNHPHLVVFQSQIINVIMSLFAFLSSVITTVCICVHIFICSSVTCYEHPSHILYFLCISNVISGITFSILPLLVHCQKCPLQLKMWKQSTKDESCTPMISSSIKKKTPSVTTVKINLWYYLKNLQCHKNVMYIDFTNWSVYPKEI